jgi:DNA-binding SARP family transcriptional activator
MIKLYLLGSFELQVEGKAIHLPTRKMEALFAYLVLHPAV